jgi:glycosyltransferase involved in cell wall biosynthesis
VPVYDAPLEHKSTQAVVVGAACRLIAPKGIMELIRAVGELQPEFPELRLEIAGAGPQLQDLKNEALRLELASHVRFLGWRNDLRPLMRTWDIFAMPSYDEGLPVAAIEAMAEGLPIVAAAVGGMPEVVDVGRTGCLVPPSDVTALVEALRRLLLDARLRQEMGAAGRRRASEHFSARRMVAEVEAVYDSLLTQSAGQQWSQRKFG